MVHPSSATLNSLARFLEDAIPIYDVCSSVIKSLPGIGDASTAMLIPVDTMDLEQSSLSNDAPIRHQTFLELTCKRIM